VIDTSNFRSVALGAILTAGLAFSAAADEAKPEDAGNSGQGMSVGEATDNMVEDAGKVADKAKEIGSDIAEGAEEAYDSAKEAVEEATE